MRRMRGTGKKPPGADAFECHAALPVPHPGHGGAGGRQTGRGAADACPLEPYIKNCARIIDGIHLNVLTAIALRRKKDERWRERLTAALDAATEYRFIRTVSVYGTAVLPLLEALDWDGDKAWRKRLMAAVRTQAAFYPHFLEPSLVPGEELTPTELQVLHLLRGQVQR